MCNFEPRELISQTCYCRWELLMCMSRSHVLGLVLSFLQNAFIGIWLQIVLKNPLIGCALALAKGYLLPSSGPMVRHNCHGMTVWYHRPYPLWIFMRQPKYKLMSMFLLFLPFKSFKRAVKQEMGVWKWSFNGKLRWTIAPLTFHNQEMIVFGINGDKSNLGNCSKI